MLVFIVIVVVVVVWAVLIKLSKKYGYAVHTASYYAEAELALRNGATVTGAMYSGLKMVQRQNFFSQLTEEDIIFLAESFTPLNSIHYLGGLLINTVKDNNISLLKDREYIKNTITFLLAKENP